MSTAAQMPLSGEPPAMTIAEAVRAIGRWVEERRTGLLAIVCKVTGNGALIRYATNTGSYHWVRIDSLARRADCDDNPDPDWLAKARTARRRSVDLHYVLHPPAQEVVDELTYRAYVFNRQRSPEVSPERWGLLFSNVDELEARFQAERGAERPPMFDTDAEGRVR